MTLAKLIADYAQQHLTSLNDWYTWKVNSAHLPANISIDNTASVFEQNSQLKRALASAWQTADDNRRLELTKYYIYTWGGVRANAQTTLNDYATHSADSLISRGKSGIASWSKALCVRDPHTYAIYDARVAAALNALQMIHRPQVVQYFPVLSSRNTTIAATNDKMKALRKQRQWVQEGEATFYRTYLNALREASALFEKASRPPVYTLEMLLFAKAEELVAQAGLV